MLAFKSGGTWNTRFGRKHKIKRDKKHTKKVENVGEFNVNSIASASESNIRGSKKMLVGIHTCDNDDDMMMLSFKWWMIRSDGNAAFLAVQRTDTSSPPTLAPWSPECG